MKHRERVKSMLMKGRKRRSRDSGTASDSSSSEGTIAETKPAEILKAVQKVVRRRVRRRDRSADEEHGASPPRMFQDRSPSRSETRAPVAKMPRQQVSGRRKTAKRSSAPQLRDLSPEKPAEPSPRVFHEPSPSAERSGSPQVFTKLTKVTKQIPLLERVTAARQAATEERSPSPELNPEADPELEKLRAFNAKAFNDEALEQEAKRALKASAQLHKEARRKKAAPDAESRKRRKVKTVEKVEKVEPEVDANAQLDALRAFNNSLQVEELRSFNNRVRPPKMTKFKSRALPITGARRVNFIPTKPNHRTNPRKNRKRRARLKKKYASDVSS